MIAPCFVDANILVYSRDPSEPIKFEVARTLMRRLSSERRGRTSIQALNEFYTVRTRKASKPVSRELAWADVEELLEWDPLPVSAPVIIRGRSVEARYKLSWWDSLIVAAAQLQGCSILYTEDLQNGANFDGLRVNNPFVTQVQEEPASYTVQVISPHRPRGRPRKQAMA
jgi:predicted nucleic acid-binding protein